MEKQSGLSELFAYMCVCRVLLRLLFEGGVYSKKYGTIITMAFVRLLLLLHLLMSTKNLTSRQVIARNSAFLFDQKNFRVWIHCSTWSNLMQEIQFLEFRGGSNSTHAHSNYLICMRLIWYSYFMTNACSKVNIHSRTHVWNLYRQPLSSLSFLLSRSPLSREADV